MGARTTRVYGEILNVKDDRSYIRVNSGYDWVDSSRVQDLGDGTLRVEESAINSSWDLRIARNKNKALIKWLMEKRSAAETK